MNLTAEQLARLCAATVGNASRFVDPLNAAMDHYDINTKERTIMFLANASVESGRLAHMEENLSYSAKRLTQVWPRRFPSLDAALPYAMNPKALANKVYANRMGNGDEASGDGWNYRGRGLFELTGHDNYALAESELGMEVTGDNADRVGQPEGAAWTACWFWYRNGCNAMADAGNFKAVCQRINGGLIGYADRTKQYDEDEHMQVFQFAMANVADVSFA